MQIWIVARYETCISVRLHPFIKRQRALNVHSPSHSAVNTVAAEAQVAANIDVHACSLCMYICPCGWVYI